VSDIFREVEEDVRKERLEKLWKTYGEYVMALIVIAILGVAGWQVWKYYQDGQAGKAATAFTAAQHIANPEEAAAAYDALIKTAPGGYGQLALLSKANALASANKTSDAMAIYKDIAAKDSGPLGAVARLRAAWLEADTASRADLQSLLAPINTDTSAWKQLAREVLAYSDYKAGKIAEAGDAFEALVNDTASPDGLKNRARAFAAFLKSGGGANFGTVPPPAPAPVPGTPPTANP
jgi:hypothetical protein